MDHAYWISCLAWSRANFLFVNQKVMSSPCYKLKLCSNAFLQCHRLHCCMAHSSWISMSRIWSLQWLCVEIPQSDHGYCVVQQCNCNAVFGHVALNSIHKCFTIACTKFKTSILVLNVHSLTTCLTVSLWKFLQTFCAYFNCWIFELAFLNLNYFKPLKMEIQLCGHYWNRKGNKILKV
jgi:hypothetical protein